MKTAGQIATWWNSLSSKRRRHILGVDKCDPFWLQFRQLPPNAMKYAILLHAEETRRV